MEALSRSEKLTEALGEYAKALSENYSQGMKFARNKVINILEECVPEPLNGECWNDCIFEIMQEIDNLRD